MNECVSGSVQVMRVTESSKVSNSAVNVLGIFAKVIEEWNEINIADPDLKLMGVIKVTDVRGASVIL